MNLKTVFFIINRYLFLSWANKKKQRLGSAIGTLLPITGVAIGVFAFTVVLSVMGGFVHEIKKNLLDMQPHIEIIPQKAGEELPALAALPAIIQTLSNQIQSVSPFQRGDVILQANSKATMATLVGIDPVSSEKTLELKKFIFSAPTINILSQKRRADNINHSALFPTVFLGKSLMEQLNLHVGESVTLVSILPDDNLGIAPLQYPAVVAGIVYSGNFAIDNTIVLSSIETTNGFFQTPSTWSGLHVRISNPMEADKVTKKLDEKLKNISSKINLNKQKIKTKSWMENNSALLRALKLEHYGMILVIAMIIVVGCFSISITLLLSVRRRVKEMAILRSLGLQKSDLSRIYLWQGFTIGLAGVVLGLVLGAITLYIVHHYRIPLITNSYSDEPLPIVVNYWDLVAVSLGSLALAMLAAVWPAMEVKNLDVVAILTFRA